MLLQPDTTMMTSSESPANITDQELIDFLVGFPNNKSNSSYTNCVQYPDPYLDLPTPAQCSYPSDLNQHLLENWEPGEILEQEPAATSKKRKMSTVSLPTSPCPVSPPPTPKPTRTSSKRTKTRANSESDHKNTKRKDSSSSSTTPKKRGPRPKQLTPAERKQKRVDANDRERQRMGKLNLAFNSLRHLLPRHGNDRELSKFETIQIAKNYIRSLHEMLVQTETSGSSESYSNTGLDPSSTYLTPPQEPQPYSPYFSQNSY